MFRDRWYCRAEPSSFLYQLKQEMLKQVQHGVQHKVQHDTIGEVSSWIHFRIRYGGFLIKIMWLQRQLLSGKERNGAIPGMSSDTYYAWRDVFYIVFTVVKSEEQLGQHDLDPGNCYDQRSIYKIMVIHTSMNRQDWPLPLWSHGNRLSTTRHKKRLSLKPGIIPVQSWYDMQSSEAIYSSWNMQSAMQ